MSLQCETDRIPIVGKLTAVLLACASENTKDYRSGTSEMPPLIFHSGIKIYLVESNKPNKLHGAECLWEANSRLANEQISCLLSKPKFHYSVLKDPLLGLCQSNPAHTSHPMHLRFILMLFSHLCLDLTTGLLPWGFPTKTSHFSILPCVLHDKNIPNVIIRAKKVILPFRDQWWEK
jgi:hypothetical protein